MLNYYLSLTTKNFSWIKEWDQVLESDFKEPKTNWFIGGKVNIVDNCLERHLPSKADDVAIVWEANEIGVKSQEITYQQLSNQVGQLANLLIDNGIQAGDRVVIYMPMIPEAVVSMLACEKIGAVHSVVFAGFSAEALAGRVEDC